MSAPSSTSKAPVPQPLGRRVGVTLLLFVVLGSGSLIAWLGWREMQDSRRVFEAWTRTDAEFIRQMNLPRSPKLARDLSRLLDVEVMFRERPLFGESPKGVQLQADGREVVVHAVDDATEAVFTRAAPAVALWRGSTLGGLAVFWALSAGLAWYLSRSLVRPLQSLSGQLPAILGPGAVVPAEAGRGDEIGALARALVQARDELNLERERRAESERLALLGRMATGLAHEIKNPLASIRLHAELMEAGARAEDEEALVHILAESQVIEGLVNQWLFLAKPELPQRVKLDLRAVAEGVMSALAAQMMHADVVADLRLEPEAAWVMGDRQRLAQALRNLVVNAIQAMPSGGTLMLTVGRDVERGEVRVEVMDSGRGFSEEALRLGTDLFFSEKEGGMGVGLNVVAEIIAAHQGTLTLQNGAGGGACVRVSLPGTGIENLNSGNS
ncbi:MAG: HAMP domain-containing histidine kinase [Verrucomicrobiaceae bacterium]|nr:HAMP domain-containing histidine kinase [Verrucomicrobiaceae bacterium]